MIKGDDIVKMFESVEKMKTAIVKGLFLKAYFKSLIVDLFLLLVKIISPESG